MGILAHCPNGHRIKVKDRLAGKRGLCPTCGAKFRIPKLVEAAVPPSPGRHAPHDLPLARFVPIDPAVVATLPRALPYGAGRGIELPAHAAAERTVSAARVSAPASPMSAAIAERPELAWCIAHPGGSPSAPIDGPAMQEWLVGGRATGEELVWRADWPDWRPIRGVFPEFFPGA